jgi:NTE family protein
VVFSESETHEVEVLKAVRASMSYPFVFRPVPIGEQFLVDGGLSINLPIHIFEAERRHQRVPIIAFDLIDVRPAVAPKYRIKNYVGDMITTALSSSQHLLHATLAGIYQVPIEIPSDIRTLDFQLTEARKQDLYHIGYSATAKFFTTRFPQIKAAKSVVETLQAQYVAPRFINPVLEAIAIDFERNTKAQNVRCNVMMAYDQENKIVAYQYGMDYDSDLTLSLPVDSGCSGLAWQRRTIVFADLGDAKESFATEYGMTQEAQNLIPGERFGLLSVPIFDYSRSIGEVDEEFLPILGILSIDTTTKLEETEWTAAAQSWTVEKSKQWATVISRVLS